jgi:hypothetical protein
VLVFVAAIYAIIFFRLIEDASILMPYLLKIVLKRLFFSWLEATNHNLKIGWPSIIDPKGGFVSLQRRIRQDFKNHCKTLNFLKKTGYKIKCLRK